MGNKHSRVERSLGQKFPPGAHFFGFENYGNTCYFNSVLQALYYCESFRSTILASDCAPDGKDSLLSALQELFEQIAHNKRKTGIIYPKRFWNRLRRENELFDSTMQQDAQEFLNYLLDALSDIIKEQLCERNGGGSGSNSRTGSTGSADEHKSWIQEIFEGTFTNETRCLCCETVTKRDENFLSVSVGITQNSSVSSCLRGFSSVDSLRGDEKYQCDECCSKQEGEKRMRIKVLPQVLAIHLKRFEWVDRLQRSTKLSHRVVFPFELRVFNTTDDAESPDQIYDLFAAVVHVGQSISRGHYVTVARSGDLWLLFDDADVQVVDPAEVEEFFGMTDKQQDASKTSETGYILFYESRKEGKPSGTS